MNNWWKDAGCSEVDDPADVRIDMCRNCPVLEDCLMDALSFEAGKARWAFYYLRGGCSPGQRSAALDESHHDEAAAFVHLKEQLHGTVTAYEGGCRCLECSKARSKHDAKMRLNRKEKLSGV
jgi:hypothetical protein